MVERQHPPLIVCDLPDIGVEDHQNGQLGSDERSTYAFAFALAQIEEMCLAIQKAMGVDARLTVDPDTLLAILVSNDDLEEEDGSAMMEEDVIQHLLEARRVLRAGRRVMSHEVERGNGFWDVVLITGPEIDPEYVGQEEGLDSETASAVGLHRLAASVVSSINRGTCALIERHRGMSH